MSDTPLTKIDLTSCDREPIHIPGAVQPYGALIVCSSAGIIQHTTRNIKNFLGVSAEKLIGSQLSDTLPHPVYDTFAKLSQLPTLREFPARAFGVVTGEETALDIAVHAIDEHLIVEFEHCSSEPELSNPSLFHAKKLLGHVQKATSIDEYFKQAVDIIRSVVGFDRVMLYQFQPDLSGQVIAEAKREGIGSYLNLYYPASDIPQQARQLYLKSWIRVIPDINYQPVAIEPSLTASGQPIDLSLVSIRSVSPIHVEYLRNMGVAATLTISIIMHGQLWGLFACHHYSSKSVSAAMRTVLELFGQFFSLQLEARLQSETLDYRLKARNKIDHFLFHISADKSIVENLQAHRDLIVSLIECDGFGVFIDGEFYGLGTVPPPGKIDALMNRIAKKTRNDIWATHILGNEYPDAASYAGDVSGVLAIPVTRLGRDYLLFFRREVTKSVTWAGNPEKPVETTTGSERLSPRKSFEAWKATVHGQSRPWTLAELEVGRALKMAILEVVARHKELVDQERTAAQRRQEIVIGELNHRIKNILALVRALITQSRDGAGSLVSFAKILDGRIRALSISHDQLTERKWRDAPLRRLLEAELSPFLSDDRWHIKLTGPDVTLDSHTYTTLALVFHELTTNASKYGCLSIPGGELLVHWLIDQTGALYITWRESRGPKVNTLPRKGFGSTLIARVIPYELKGTADVALEPDGLIARFRVPGSFASTPSTSSSTQKVTHKAKPSPQPNVRFRTALIVEDNMLIALDLEAMLKELGIEEVIVAGSLAVAQRLIESKRFDLALLDIGLGVETSFPLAEGLRHMGTSFAFATGYGETGEIPDEFKSVPILQKPFDNDALLALLTSFE